MREVIVHTAAMILAQNAKAMTGHGLHKSPTIVGEALDLAVMLDDEIGLREDREASALEVLKATHARELEAHAATKLKLAAALEKLKVIEDAAAKAAAAVAAAKPPPTTAPSSGAVVTRP